MNTTSIIDQATVITIRHPEESYAIFCFTEKGTLFIESDWGFYGHRWGGIGKSMKEFLSSIDEEYFIKKLEINHFNETGKKIVNRRKIALKVLFLEFQKTLKNI